MKKVRIAYWIRLGVAWGICGGLTAAMIAWPIPLAWALPVMWLVGVLVAFIAGRWFCSIGCPLGLLQETCGNLCRIGKGRKRAYRSEKNHRHLRYCMLTAVVACMLFGVLLPLTVLEPYSNFSRMLTTGRQAGGFWMILWSGGFLLLLVAASVWKGRIFCQTLCPVGAVLGLASRGSSIRLQLDPTRCVKCQKCVKVCPSGCVNPQGEGVDAERCTWCFGCESVCPTGAIHVTRQNAKHSLRPDPERRKFFTVLGAVAAGSALAVTGARRLGAASVNGEEGGNVPPVMPPGAMNQDRFFSRCTGCQLCVGACTGHVLATANPIRYGILNPGKPYLDFTQGMCEFRCHKCSNICPTGALQAITLAKKQRLRVGLARYQKDNCVVFIDKERDCGACAEHCPTGALQMRVTPDGYRLPHIIEELCIGCGNCAKACPQKDHCPLVIHGESVQVIATDPNEYFKTQENVPPPSLGGWAF